MGRPPLPVGTAGKIRFQKLGPRRIRARVNVRDYDGETREVTRFGHSQPAAERALKEALRDRVGPPTSGEITTETRLRAAATLWQAEIAESDTLTPQTQEIYERTLERITKGLGGLLIREIDVPVCDRFIKAVRKNHGPSAAKTTRDVLSLLLGMVVRHGALDTNPVREIAKISTGRKTRPKALSREDEAVMLAKVASDECAAELDAADLIEFLDGTGMRVGEALGVRAEVIDLEAGVLEVNATSVRLKGKGTCLQLRPKTEAGWRVIALPPHVVELCRRRAATSWPYGDRKITVICEDGEEVQSPAGDVGLLFPGLFGGVRNPSNANRDVKKVLARVDTERFGWVTSHTFRKTVATRLDEAGLSARAIADHLGHAKPSMTQDVYMGRNVASAEAAEVLGKRSV
ncbi:site-specific recombinase XerD [Actinomadura pelletieri DSM 43383]|uniref:Site-specific recombinase XerD n=1 Tax=Actinomadura pelletieri DSM 43383 TaxID=1120940 RepID=A0A495QSP4_9ACTN|nr:site-specific integrase [Actinomadura pelletieri]RKS76473.1 site-specific recombinase XerD [Actinomadura pelletieri DSM 43383]